MDTGRRLQAAPLITGRKIQAAGLSVMLCRLINERSQD